MSVQSCWGWLHTLTVIPPYRSSALRQVPRVDKVYSGYWRVSNMWTSHWDMDTIRWTLVSPLQWEQGATKLIQLQPITFVSLNQTTSVVTNYNENNVMCTFLSFTNLKRSEDVSNCAPLEVDQLISVGQLDWPPVERRSSEIFVEHL